MRMTPEQKEANKKITKARDKAYRERRREYEAAMTLALAPFPLKPEDGDASSLVSEESKAYWAATERFEQVLKAVNDEEMKIRAQIAELQESLKTVRDRHDYSGGHAARNEAHTAVFAARRTVEDQVKAEFSDIADVFYAAQWGAIVDFKLQEE